MRRKSIFHHRLGSFSYQHRGDCSLLSSNWLALRGNQLRRRQRLWEVCGATQGAEKEDNCECEWRDNENQPTRSISRPLFSPQENKQADKTGTMVWKLRARQQKLNRTLLSLHFRKVFLRRRRIRVFLQPRGWLGRKRIYVCFLHTARSKRSKRRWKKSRVRAAALKTRWRHKECALLTCTSTNLRPPNWLTASARALPQKDAISLIPRV